MFLRSLKKQLQNTSSAFSDQLKGCDPAGFSTVTLHKGNVVTL